MPQRSKRDRDGDVTSGRQSSRDTRLTQFITRLVALTLCLLLAFLAGGLGRHILKTGEYNYTLETSERVDPVAFDRVIDVKQETVRATGDWAHEQGIGFIASAVTFGLWGVGILWSMARSAARRDEWTLLHTLYTVVSLLCLGVTIGAFFPPWRIGQSMSANAFYLVMLAIVGLAALRDSEKVRKWAPRVFTGLIVSAIVISSFSSGYLVGIIAGIFMGLILAMHILLLMPKLRNSLKSQTTGDLVA